MDVLIVKSGPKDQTFSLIKFFLTKTDFVTDMREKCSLESFNKYFESL